MTSFFQSSKESAIRKVLSIVVLTTFLLSTFAQNNVFAATVTLPTTMPVPGTMMGLSKAFMPVSVKGLMVHPDNPFRFDFLVDSGDTGLKGEALKAESLKLAKYFLAALTVPENDMWVNLSPYEKNRVIPASFGDTELGADVLAQDFLLKQLTASLTYPETSMGHKFWDKVYAEVQHKYGQVNVPTNSFNKVWIMPAKARVYEHGNGAFVVESTLKVMLETDYLATKKNDEMTGPARVASGIVREIILPALEKEVNEGAHFSNLRQIFQTMILATWYKVRLKDSIIAKQYVDQAKTKGVDIADKKANENTYQQYLKAFKKGAYNYIKETNLPNGKKEPRKYISGGVVGVDKATLSISQVVTAGDQATLAPRGDQAVVKVDALPTEIKSPLNVREFLDVSGRTVESRQDERLAKLRLLDRSGVIALNMQLQSLPPLKGVIGEPQETELRNRSELQRAINRALGEKADRNAAMTVASLNTMEVYVQEFLGLEKGIQVEELESMPQSELERLWKELNDISEAQQYLRAEEPKVLAAIELVRTRLESTAAGKKFLADPDSAMSVEILNQLVASADVETILKGKSAAELIAIQRKIGQVLGNNLKKPQPDFTIPGSVDAQAYYGKLRALTSLIDNLLSTRLGSLKSPQMLWEGYQAAANKIQYLQGLSNVEFSRLRIYLTDLRVTTAQEVQEVSKAIQIFRNWPTADGAMTVEAVIAQLQEQDNFPTDIPWQQVQAFLLGNLDRNTVVANYAQDNISRRTNIQDLLNFAISLRDGTKYVPPVGSLYELAEREDAAMTTAAVIEALRDPIATGKVRARFIKNALKDPSLEPEVIDFLNQALIRRQAVEKNTYTKRLTMDDLNQPMQEVINRYLAEFGWRNANVQVLNKDRDLKRLTDEEVAEGLATGNAMRLNDGNIYLRSNPNDVARDPKSTMVSTNNPEDAGLFNNWKKQSDLRPKLIELMKNGAKESDTVYVLVYLIGTVGDPKARIGVQITTSRQVAMQIMTLYKVGIDAISQLGDSDQFTKGVNVPGDIDAIYKKLNDTKGQEDDRHFAAFVDEDEFLSYGSAYGGNAIFPKKFELRLGNWKFVKETLKGNNPRLTEHMFILQLKDKKTGKKHTVLGAFPAQGGKTGMGTIEVPDGMELEAWFLADDLVSIEPGKDGWYAQPVEDGLFAVIYGTGPKDSPRLMKALKPNTNILYTNIARNTKTGEAWWEKRTKGFPEFKEDTYRDWMDWKGDPIFARPVSDQEAQAQFGKDNRELTPAERWTIQVKKGVWAHPNSRASIPVENMDNLSPDFDNPLGTKVSVILAGGYNEFYPLLMVPFSAKAGIVDQFFNVALSTAATAGKVGELKEDGFAMRDFFASNEIAHLLAWLEVADKTKDTMPLLAHINQKKKEWEGFGKNTILLDLMIRYIEAETQEEKNKLFRRTALGLIPRADAMDIKGVINSVTGKQLTFDELEKLLSYDPYYWLNNELPRRYAYVDKANRVTKGIKVPSVVIEELDALKLRLQNEIAALELKQVDKNLQQPSFYTVQATGERRLILWSGTQLANPQTVLRLNEALKEADLASDFELYELSSEEGGIAYHRVVLSPKIIASDITLELAARFKSQIDLVRARSILAATGEYDGAMASSQIDILRAIQKNLGASKYQPQFVDINGVRTMVLFRGKHDKNEILFISGLISEIVNSEDRFKDKGFRVQTGKVLWRSQEASKGVQELVIGVGLPSASGSRELSIAEWTLLHEYFGPALKKAVEQRLKQMDSAMTRSVVPAPINNGGIDLQVKNINLKIDADKANNVKAPWNLNNVKIEGGLIPTIIGIQTKVDLPLLLGLKNGLPVDHKEDVQLSQPAPMHRPDWLDS